jgi:hypothetical protein
MYSGQGQGAINAAQAGLNLAAAAGCLFVVLQLTWFIWYIVSLILVRSAISDRIG